MHCHHLFIYGHTKCINVDFSLSSPSSLCIVLRSTYISICCAVILCMRLCVKDEERTKHRKDERNEQRDGAASEGEGNIIKMFDGKSASRSRAYECQCTLNKRKINNTKISTQKPLK